uniref:Uncharacterized protein n=1 Tax=Triatoma infestans TaxID=30076 RepID=A0A170U7V4_TRIIF
MVFVNSNLYLWNWKTGMKICCLSNCLEWIGDF